MATTVIAAFNEFMKDTVNLEKADTDDARASRDWLIGKINDFENDEVFPVSYPGIHIAFGSFARRTKIRPLDVFQVRGAGILQFPDLRWNTAGSVLIMQH